MGIKGKIPMYFLVFIWVFNESSIIPMRSDMANEP